MDPVAKVAPDDTCTYLYIVLFVNSTVLFIWTKEPSYHQTDFFTYLTYNQYSYFPYQIIKKKHQDRK